MKVTRLLRIVAEQTKLVPGIRGGWEWISVHPARRAPQLPVARIPLALVTHDQAGHMQAGVGVHQGADGLHVQPRAVQPPSVLRPSAHPRAQQQAAQRQQPQLRGGGAGDGGEQRCEMSPPQSGGAQGQQLQPRQLRQRVQQGAELQVVDGLLRDVIAHGQRSQPRPLSGTQQPQQVGAHVRGDSIIPSRPAGERQPLESGRSSEEAADGCVDLGEVQMAVHRYDEVQRLQAAALQQGVHAFQRHALQLSQVGARRQRTHRQVGWHVPQGDARQRSRVRLQQVLERVDTCR